MPSRERIEGLIARVEAGQFVEALQEFYAEDATMQENLDPPRAGLANLVAHERRVMASFKETRASAIRPFFVEGDHVVINWVFEFTDPGGRMRRLDELAHQRWRAERVCQERFYYDPAALRR